MAEIVREYRDDCSANHFQPPVFIPTGICDADTPHPVVAFTAPAGGSVITSAPLTIFGRASAGSAFKDWVLEYGVGSDPDHWPDLAIGKSPLENPGELFVWDLAGVPNGPITLRLTRTDNSNLGRGLQGRIVLTVNASGRVDRPNVSFVVPDDTTDEIFETVVFTASRSGVAQFVYPNDILCLRAVRQLINYLPSNNKQKAPILDLNDPPASTPLAIFEWDGDVQSVAVRLVVEREMVIWQLWIRA